MTETKLDEDFIKIVYDADDEDFDRMVFGILDDVDAVIDNIAWKSKYNNYVIYDYEPFNTSGFNKVISLKKNINHNLFAEYLINKRMEKNEELQKVYAL